MEKGHHVKALGEANVLAESVSLPAAVLHRSKLEQNVKWMQAYCDHSEVKFAPHGKTTMTPHIFRQQLAQGAWGLTLATPIQIKAGYQAGCQNLLMANQLVGKANMAIISEILTDQEVAFYCVVDNSDNVAALSQFFSDAGQTLNVLIEYGVQGGRCGCRTSDQVVELANEIASYSALNLAGIEVYEGVIHGDNAAEEIRTFLTEVADTFMVLDNAGLFTARQKLLTGAGSAWYDVVAACFKDAALPEHTLCVLRPGCYVIHDEGIYDQAQSKVLQRNSMACSISGDLLSCLELWAYVISTPEPGRVICGLGKRDAAFDAGLPQAITQFRPGSKSTTSLRGSGWNSVAIMDQHIMVEVPHDADVKVGDLLAFNQSHPCLTMDKWRYLHIVDEEYNVVDTVETVF